MTAITSLWPHVPLGRVLTRRKDEVFISDGNAYRRLTIRMHGAGIVIRDEVPGSEIGTKLQFRVHAGQLLLSKIDARNGAFGLVPASCDRAIIIGNFWTFDVDQQALDARFFNWFTKTPRFRDFCIAASEGTTNRRYLQEPAFLAQKIPLPPLPEQRRIVARIEQLNTRGVQRHEKVPIWRQ